MTLKEAWPQFEYLHLMQPRLDKAGATVEDFIEAVKSGKTSHGTIPPEITRQGQAATLVFMGDFGWAYLSKLITEIYPQ